MDFLQKPNENTMYTLHFEKKKTQKLIFFTFQGGCTFFTDSQILTKIALKIAFFIFFIPDCRKNTKVKDYSLVFYGKWYKNLFFANFWSFLLLMPQKKLWKRFIKYSFVLKSILFIKATNHFEGIFELWMHPEILNFKDLWQ